MKRPIEPSEIRKGDLIEHVVPWAGGSEHIYRGRVVRVDDYNVWIGHESSRPLGWGTGADGVKTYLLDRPKTLLYPAGTDLWLTDDLYPWGAGDMFTLAKDWYEGDLGAARNGCWVPLNLVTDKRPEPAVDVPTTPTVGWLEWDDRRELGVWWRSAGGVSVIGRVLPALARIQAIPLNEVTAFSPATAVQTAALHALRAGHERSGGCGYYVQTFLDAVDGAAS